MKHPFLAGLWQAGAFAALLALGCGPPPGPAAPPTSTVPVAATVGPAPTAAVDLPTEVIPSLHPCVPNFIVKELHACEDGAGSADYSAVANAMAAVAAAGPQGPIGPQAKGKPALPRAFQPLEEKAIEAARAFLCRRPEGDLDDEHATAAFDLGRLYLGANHFEEAAVVLRDVVLLDPQKHGEVEYAARFFLEAVRGLTRDRPECVATFPAEATAVEAHVCKGAGAEQRAESCAAITRLAAEGAAQSPPPAANPPPANPPP